MGLFDSSSSSSSQTQTTTTNIDKTAGFQDSGGVLALGEVGGFGKVSVNVLDAGAVAGSLDLAKTAVTSSAQNVDSAFNLSRSVVSDLIGSQDRNIREAIQFAEDSSRSSNEFAASVANPNQEVQKDIVKNVVTGLTVVSVSAFLIYLSMKK